MTSYCRLGLVALLLATACGRFFPSELRPTDSQIDGMSVNDDGSITYDLDRLSITLKPMTDAELNRQFDSESTGGAASVNPYTFGDWTKPGDSHTPPRFTVFRVEVGNYQYPKVLLDPRRMQITTANDRTYDPLSFGDLYDYYRAHWVGRTGKGRADFRTRTDILKQTMYPNAVVFSGSDEQGYVVFPVLHDDVLDLQLHIRDVAVRFNYADEPVETIDLTFTFERDVVQAMHPVDDTATN